MIPDMAKVFKRPDSKYWQFLLNRKRVSTKCTDKHEAEAVADKVLSRLRNRKLLTFDPSIITLENAIDDYNNKRLKMEKKTQAGDKYALNLLTEYYKDKLQYKTVKLSHITKRNIDGWKEWMQNEKGFEPGGINTHIRRVKAFFKLLLKWDYITENPAMFLRQSKVIKKVAPLITKEERKRLCEEAQTFKSGQLKYAIPIMLFTGMARQEVTTNINISAETIFYVRKKTNKPVNPLIGSELRPYISDLPLGINRIFKSQPRHFSRLFEKFIKHCQDEKIISYHLTPHLIRHNFIVWFLQASGGDFEACAECVGHADHGVTILKNYSQYIPGRYKKVMDNI